MSPTYPVLGPVEFAKHILMTGDIDPIYIMLNKAQLPLDVRQRWCLAYWMFYHAGSASKIAELDSKDFFDACREHYHNKGPRGAERRHFRGQKALDAIDWLAREYRTAEQAVSMLGQFEVHQPANTLLTLATVMNRIKTWPQFGPWIAFKAADMLDAVLQRPVDFKDSYWAFFDDPKKGADHVLIGLGVEWEHLSEDNRMRLAGYHLHGALEGVRSPVSGKTPIGLQEIETVFCKYKAHVNGHYPLLKDTREISAGLDGWGPLAEKLRTILIIQQAWNLSHTDYNLGFVA